MEVDSVTQLTDLRLRVRNGEKVAPEEYEKVIASIREARTAAPTPKRSKKKSQAQVGQEVLDSLFDMKVEG